MTNLGETRLETAEDLVTDIDVLDDTEIDDTSETVRYNITSYGADFDVEGLVRRMNRGSVRVPEFQRGFVWSLKRASQFIESLLLGLPVPGIFLTHEPETENLLVIDGQQRLKTLQFFYSGAFGEVPPDDSRPRPFALVGVNPEFERLKYSDLTESDQNRLNDALLHATIVRQNTPDDGMSSIFHIFQRLNTGGMPLAPQEIRQALYRGWLMDSVKELNDNPDWRHIFGPKSLRQKDQELILRFWAMYLKADDYERPMLGFLNGFAEQNRNPSIEFLYEGRSLFAEVARAFNNAMGGGAFRTERSRQLNAAVFDSMGVGLAHYIKEKRGIAPDAVTLRRVHDALLDDADYIRSVSEGTAEVGRVQTRIHKATAAFGEL